MYPCSSASCQKEHWKTHRSDCQVVSSSLPKADLSEADQLASSEQQPSASDSSSLQTSSAPVMDVGEPQLVQLPSWEASEQERVPLASYVIYPYEGYLALAEASSTRIPLGMLNCGNRCFTIPSPHPGWHIFRISSGTRSSTAMVNSTS